MIYFKISFLFVIFNTPYLFIYTYLSERGGLKAIYKSKLYIYKQLY